MPVHKAREGAAASQPLRAQREEVIVIRDEDPPLLDGVVKEDRVRGSLREDIVARTTFQPDA